MQRSHLVDWPLRNCGAGNLKHDEVSSKFGRKHMTDRRLRVHVGGR